MVEVRGLTKRFGAEHALGPIDLVFAPGTTALIGPSGCGKSTLLRLLVGLIAPDAGEVRFDDAPLTTATVAAVRRRVGYVIQDGGLFPHLSARDNVTLMARQIGWDKTRIAARLGELMQLVHLSDDALSRYPRQLSGGQRQRVSLMRALMLDPDVILLDEPLGALDPIVRSELQVDLKAIFARLGKTVVLVTHDLGEAGFLAARIALMQAGRVLQLGALESLYESPADPFVTRFVRAQTYQLPWTPQ
ncbi:MAG TPA: ATP-binding cassette domain-containing protein [Polyangia bacterium]|nr:ATP-binding cassette domain-containing protein [Polyangia bacterium]